MKNDFQTLTIERVDYRLKEADMNYYDLFVMFERRL